MNTLQQPLKIIGHDCFEEKQRDGSIRRSFSIDAAYELGQPSVKLYISDTQANELKQKTGNGFTREEREARPHEPYQALGEFSLITKQVVKRGDSARQDRVNNQLGVKLQKLTLAKAA
jgi:hypothetical protein